MIALNYQLAAVNVLLPAGYEAVQAVAPTPATALMPPTQEAHTGTADWLEHLRFFTHCAEVNEWTDTNWHHCACSVLSGKSAPDIVLHTKVPQIVINNAIILPHQHRLALQPLLSLLFCYCILCCLLPF